MELYGRPQGRTAPMIMPDLPDTLSPIDGKVIHGRAGFRKHFAEHRVTWADDFKEEWKKPRVNPLKTKQAKTERIEALKYAVEKHRR